MTVSSLRLAGPAFTPAAGEPPFMAQDPIGTIENEDRLVALRKDAHGTDDGFSIAVTDLIEEIGIDPDATIEWTIYLASDTSRLVFGPVAEGVDEETINPRELLSADGEVIAPVPVGLLGGGDRGLGLDLGAYDDANPLLFEPTLTDDATPIENPGGHQPAPLLESAVELEPVRFDDGTPYRRDPQTEELDSDPVAEGALEHSDDADPEPQSEAISAPIAASIVDDVVETTGVSHEDLVGALETIARRDIVDTDDAVTDTDAVTAEDRVVTLGEEETWADEIAPKLDIEEEVLGAARLAHEQQADGLLRRGEVDTDRLDTTGAIVVGR